MNDDDNPTVVSSGMSHSVSVSEHTGNARTPKNIVTSSEEETLARKRAFEKKNEMSSLMEALDSAHSKSNVQTVATPDAEHNKQHIDSGATAANRQAVHAAPGGAPNVQNIPTEVLAPNVQNIGTDAIEANRQALHAAPGVAPNVQNIPTEVLAPNVQNIGTDATEANRQAVHAAPGVAPNVQNIPAEVVAPNVQNVGSGTIDSNRQAVPEHTAANTQSAPEDATAANRQALPSMQPLDNRASIASDPVTLNRQTAPEAPAIGGNRQSVDQHNIQDHHESVPSGDIQRKKVDFASAATNAAGPASSRVVTSKNVKPPEASSFKNKTDHEKAMEAFHSRVADIKSNVGQLNHRLTDLEEVVAQDVAKRPQVSPEQLNFGHNFLKK